MWRRIQHRGALVTSAAFVVVLLGVTTRATQGWDQAVVDRVRPGGSWDTVHLRLAQVVDVLAPRHSYALLGVVALAVALHRRSWRPLVLAGLLVVASVVTTLAVKWATGRPDWHGDLSSSGGSFPSGHVVALLASLGGCALVCWSRTRWWHWVLVAVPVAVLAFAITATVSHWATDVIGGLLVAVALLWLAAASPLRAETYPIWGSAAADR